MHLLLAPQNWPFATTLGLAALLGLLQVAMLLLGGAADFLQLDADADGDLDIDGPEGLSGILDWLHVGQLPISLLVMLSGLSFGLSGLFIQSLAMSRSGAMLSTGPVAALAAIAAIPMIRIGGSILRRILPRDETEAVSVESFLGCEATITVGTARRGHPAEARLHDKWGKAHYVMVEPEGDDVQFPAGSRVLILTRHEHVFRAADHSMVQEAMDRIEADPIAATPRRQPPGKTTQ